MSPHAEDDTAHTKVGADVPLHGFWVDPQDLTGISVAFSRLIEHWEDTPGETKICLRNLESLFPYHDTDMVYRFLNSVLATLQGASMEVHAHIRPSVTDDSTLELLSSLFTHIVGPTEPTRTRETASDSDGRAVKSSPGPTQAEERRATAESESRAHGGTAMSAGEIDTFLESTGHGILVFDGSPPYAIPMSYGYDADERRVYMQLSDYEGSEKQTRLEASARVSFIVARYARSDRWRSVVIDGRLTPLADSTVDRSDILEVYAQSDIATLDVFTEDSSNISFGWYVLEPDDLSGRQSINSL
jgi:hypothetical protein